MGYNDSLDVQNPKLYSNLFYFLSLPLESIWSFLGDFNFSRIVKHCSWFYYCKKHHILLQLSGASFCEKIFNQRKRKCPGLVLPPLPSFNGNCLNATKLFISRWKLSFLEAAYKKKNSQNCVLSKICFQISRISDFSIFQKRISVERFL